MSNAVELHTKPTSVRHRVRNRKLKLQKLENVDTQVDSHCAVVTICNWDRYKNPSTAGGQQSGQLQDSYRTQTIKIKKVNKVTRRVGDRSLFSRFGEARPSHKRKIGGQMPGAMDA